MSPGVDTVRVYRGETVAGGVALGKVHLRGFDAAPGLKPRIPSDQVELELNRLRDALQRSRQQIEEIRAKQESKLAPDELRIFDTHLAYLQDPLFIDEIEKQIMHERHAVRSAIATVVAHYDRILSLVESEHLRQRAGDLRDVGTRLLRNVEDDDGDVAELPRPDGRYILAAASLNTADMFDLRNDEVAGIVAEEGGITSHAAILARSMGIPTLTGISELSSKLEEGMTVAIDASAGELIVEPDEELIARFREEAARFQAERLSSSPESREHSTRDGTEVAILGSCGSTGEVDLARTYAMDGIGLFRTELPFMADRVPTEEDLVEVYGSVLRQPGTGPVNFRLLDVNATTELAGMPRIVERNPAMGARGVRRLLANPDVLRLQLRAILRAAADTTDTGVLVPFVTAVSDLAQVRSAIVEEREALRKRDVPCAGSLQVAPIIEVPAAAIVLSSFLPLADFVVVAIDDLQAYLLAADRDALSVRRYYEMVHPAMFELLNRMARDARKKDKRVVLFGEGAADPQRLPLYLGIGIRHLSIAPARMNGVLKVLHRYTIDECRDVAERILQAPRALDVERILVQLGG